jgi:hypothetical protein
MGPSKGLAQQLTHQLWAYSMPLVVMEHGPIQRSRSAAHPSAMGLFNVICSGRSWAHTKVSLTPAMGLFHAIGSDEAWAHTKVSLSSSPTSYGPIQCHRQRQSVGPYKGLTRQLTHRLWAYSMSSAAAERGPIQGSQSVAIPLAMGRAWAHTNICTSHPQWAHTNICTPYPQWAGMGFP